MVNGYRARGFSAGLVALALVCFSAADVYAGDEVATRSASLRVALQGRVVEHCQVSGGASIELGRDPQGGLSVPGAIEFDCNTPFDLTVSSTHGGLAHGTLPDGQGPYAGMLFYTVSISVPTLQSPTVGRFVEGHFQSADLVGGQTLSSQDQIAAGGGQLTIRTLAPRGAGLLAGGYSDSLTVTVASRL